MWHDALLPWPVVATGHRRWPRSLSVAGAEHYCRGAKRRDSNSGGLNRVERVAFE